MRPTRRWTHKIVSTRLSSSRRLRGVKGRKLRRIGARVFAGDPRVWRAATLLAIPLVVLIAFYFARSHDYYTGTNNVEAYRYVGRTPVGKALCVPDLQVPAGTARIRLAVRSHTRLRPSLTMTLELDSGRRTIESSLDPVRIQADRISMAVFAIPELPPHPAEEPASLCVRAADAVSWGGTPLATLTSPASPDDGLRVT
jgi:hypothetical protein